MNTTTKFLLSAAGVVALAALVKTQQPSRQQLAGQTVLVTGGSRGLGYILARELARAGCRVVICARNKSGLTWAQQTLHNQGADVLAIPCDVSDQNQVAALINEARRACGRIDILINNAGTIQVSPWPLVSVQDFVDAMNTMFWGVLYPTQAVLPHMIERGSGRIVNVTSIGGKVSVPHLLPYSCAKFAAVALSEGLRAELQGSGVQVTTIAPGLMRTGSYLNALFKGQQTKEFSWFALGASLPLLSMDAERAARQIIAALQRGDAEAILSPPAQLLARFHGLFPGVTADLLGLAAALLLPEAQSGIRTARPGRAIRPELEATRAQVLQVLTTLGQQAAARYQPEPLPN